MSGIKAGSIYYVVNIPRRETTAAIAEVTRLGNDLQATLNKAVDAKGIFKPIKDELKSLGKEIPKAAPASKPFDELRESVREAGEELKRLATEERAGLLSREEYIRGVEDQQEAMVKLGREVTHGSEAYDALTSTMGQAVTVLGRLERLTVNDALKDLRNQSRILNNDWVNNIITGEQFGAATKALQEEMMELYKSGKLTGDQMRTLGNDMAFTQRRADSFYGIASKGGLAWTAQIAIANQFGQTLRGLGPIGIATGSVLSMLQKRYAATGVAASSGSLGINAFNQSSRLGGLALAGLTGAVIAGTLAIAKQAEEISKWATSLETATHRLGLTVEGVQELHYASTQTGVKVETLESTIQSLQRRAGAAADGNKAYADAFRELGVELTDADGNMRSMEDLLPDVADGFAGLSSESDRVRLAFQTMNRQGVNMLPLLTKGSKGITELRQEARDLGLVMSAEGVAAFDAYGAEIQGVKDQFAALHRGAILEFLPSLREDMIPWLQGTAIPVFQSLVGILGSLGRAFSHDAGTGVKPYTADLAAATVTAVGLNAALGVLLRTLGLANPIIGGITLAISLGAAAYGVYKKNAEEAGTAQEQFDQAIQGTRTRALEAVDGLAALQAATDEQGLRGAVERLASRMTGDAKDAFIEYSEQAILSAGDVQEAMALISAASIGPDLDKAKADHERMLNELRSVNEGLRFTEIGYQLAVEQRHEAQQKAHLEQLEADYLEKEALEEKIKISRNLVDTLTEAYENPTRAAGILAARIADQRDSMDEAAASADVLADTLQSLIARQSELNEAFDKAEIGSTEQAEIGAELQAIAEQIAQINELRQAASKSKKTVKDAIVEEANGISQGASILKMAFEQGLIEREEYLEQLEVLYDRINELNDRAATTEQSQATLSTRGNLMDQLGLNDVLKGTRVWTERLTAQVETGTKSAGEAMQLLAPAARRLREELAELDEQGQIGTPLWQEKKDKLDLVAGALNEARAAALSTAEALVETSKAKLVDPAAAVNPIKEILDYYQDGVLRLADTQAELMGGVTQETRAVYADTLTLFEQVLERQVEGTDEWFAMADAVVALRGKVAALDEELAPFRAGLSLPDPFAQWSDPDAGIRMTLQIVEQMQGRFLNLDDAISKVWASGMILTEDMLQYLVKEFDAVDGKAAGLSDALGRLNLQMDGGQLVAAVGKYELMRTALTELAQAAGLSAEELALVNTEIDKMESEDAADAAIKEADALLKLNEAQREYGLSVASKQEILEQNIAALEAQRAEHEEGSAEYLNLITAINGYRQALREANEVPFGTGPGFGMTQDVDAAAIILSNYYSKLATTTKGLEELGIAEESYQGVIREGIEVLQIQLRGMKATDEGYDQLISTLLNLMSLDPLANLEKRLSTLGHESKDVFEQMRADIEALTDIDPEKRIELLAEVDVKKFEADMRTADKAVKDHGKAMAAAAASARIFGETRDRARKQADATRQAIEALIPLLGEEDEEVQRLKDSWEELNTEAEATEAWEEHTKRISEWLGIVPSEFDKMRKDAKAAFDAGVIGAEELAVALKAIKLMELQASFERISGILDGVGSSMHSAAGQVVQGIAQITAAAENGEQSLEGYTMIVQGLTTAIEGFKDASKDGFDGNDLFDLYAGAGSMVATAIGGPAMGELFAATSQLLKSILGDFGNGLKQIEAQIEQMTGRFPLLAKESIKAFTDPQVSQISRGGVLGWLGFTKAGLTEEAQEYVNELLAIGDGVAGSLESALKSADFSKDFNLGLDRVIQQELIKGLILSPEVQAQIVAITEAIKAGDLDLARSLVAGLTETLQEGHEWLQELLPDLYEVGSGLAGGFVNGMRAARDAVLAGSSTQEVHDAISGGLRQAILDEILQGVIEAALASGELEEILKQITEAIAEGDYDLARRLLADADTVIDDAADLAVEVFGPFKKTAEEIHRELVKQISGGLESGFRSGAKSARDIILAGGSAEEVSAAITNGLKQAVMDQILEGIIAAALLEGALAEHIEAIADAIARGDYETARQLMEQTGEVVEGFTNELSGVFDPFTESAEEAFKRLSASLADSIQSSLQSAFEGAVQNYLDHGNLSTLTDEFEAALYTSVSNALISAIVEQALMKTVLEGGIAGIAEAIAAGDHARAAELTQSVMSVIPEFAKSLEPILGIIRGAAPDSVRRGWSSNQPATPDRGNTGGVQVAEITGPSRDILVDLLSPLRGLDGLLGVQLRQLAVLESTWTLLDERLHGGPGPAPAYTGTGGPQDGGAVSNTHHHNYYFDDKGAVETDFDDPDFRRDLEDLIDDHTARGLRRRGR